MMSEGDKHDQDKARWDLLPMRAVSDIVDVLTYGAKKYTPNGWRKVKDARARYYAAALRHLIAWWMGEERDKESGLPHLAHAGCCLIFLSELGMPLLDQMMETEGVEERHLHRQALEELEREEGAGPAKPASTLGVGYILQSGAHYLLSPITRQWTKEKAGAHVFREEATALAVAVEIFKDPRHRGVFVLRHEF